jgi:UDP-N-acetylmuramate--alanine ligase
MSALARYFHSQDYNVAGYDKTSSPLTRQLEDEGIQINFLDQVDKIGSDFTTYPDAVMVVYTPAIPLDNQILNYFSVQNYTLVKRAEMLGTITRQTTSLCVAGTHGKTTTSCIVASILQQSDLQFSAFLGGISTNLASNYYYQQGTTKEHYSVAEADEFDRSFLHLRPSFSVITSTDADHLDIYGAATAIEESYVEYSELIESEENRFYAKGKAKGIRGISYSVTDTSADFFAKVHKVSLQETGFSIKGKDNQTLIGNLTWDTPGEHNLENAVGAALMTLKAGVTEEAVRAGLANFKGIKRRFEFIIEQEKFVYIDDYAHHPSELRALISSVKKLYPNKKITAIFQPHLFSRTQDFMDEFARELEQVNDLILLPIYPARELPIEGVTSERLLSKVNLKNRICLSRDEVIGKLQHKRVEVLLTLGAGDIDRLVPQLKEYFGAK